MMTTIVVIFDALAALALFVFGTILTREWASTSCKNPEKKYLLLRRSVYACVAIALAYRIWDIVETGREISTIGALVNLVLVSGFLILAFARLVARRSHPQGEITKCSPD